ncbi:hypothetical protein MTBBW1_630032 [Desulfamplus magnetovallimortis]|uniref:Uncharacterized protein n=1 Tax=Desulfamplus magnetovallimortis TaxID=1246637 RepID=A0A1W1HJ00_9BACT|nr:hypothetical protein [Desulfamplus magnetovallimortis]SLM32338.1 hypothetical protein MTBBW1_630032 [Desulfamplus magnetovallimortis]
MNPLKDKYLPDRKFLEFWGNLLLNAAKGQEQLEQLSSLMNMDGAINKDVVNLKGMNDLFRQFYGLEFPLKSTNREKEPENKKRDVGEHSVEETVRNFQKSFEIYATMWGWVPRKKHEKLQMQLEDLQKEFEGLKLAHDDLKQKVKSQEGIISQLRNLLSDGGQGHVEFFRQFQDLAKKQSVDFQNFLCNLNTMFTKEDNDKK